jgi:hypothetical protein
MPDKRMLRRMLRPDPDGEPEMEYPDGSFFKIQKRVQKRVRLPDPPRPRQRRPFEYIPREPLHQRRQVDRLKPLQLRRGKDAVEFRELMVFKDGDKLVISIITSRGTLNIPVARKTASEIVCALTKQLVP